MSHSSGVSSLMLDIKYDFGLLQPPALVIVMQVKQNTLSHALHLLCNGDTFMISNQCQVCLLLWLRVCVRVHSSFKSSLFGRICTTKGLTAQVCSQLESYCICASASLFKSRSADLCNLYLTLVRIIIWRLFIQL